MARKHCINKFEKELKVIVFRIVKIKQSSFEDSWNKITNSFNDWCEELPAPLSPLVGRLEFLKKICESFPDYSLKDNSDIVNVVLSNTAKIGDIINIKGHSNKFNVISRKILNDFGILFVLQDREGNKLEHVFYD